MQEDFSCEVKDWRISGDSLTLACETWFWGKNSDNTINTRFLQNNQKKRQHKCHSLTKYILILTQGCCEVSLLCALDMLLRQFQLEVQEQEVVLLQNDCANKVETFLIQQSCLCSSPCAGEGRQFGFLDDSCQVLNTKSVLVSLLLP